jgi:hypothetical protein
MRDEREKRKAGTVLRKAGTVLRTNRGRGPPPPSMTVDVK